MKKIIISILVFIFVFPVFVYAGRGCCSSHGGVCGCTSYGKNLCCDGTTSPSCGCTPPKVYGCTDYKADNYNSEANTDDGSCTYTIFGCTDVAANNYNVNATKDDGSCTYDVRGCMDINSSNYNPSANVDDGSCTYTRSMGDVATFEDESDNINNSDDSSGVIGLLAITGFASVPIIKKVSKKH